jgi:hypothetical protein
MSVHFTISNRLRSAQSLSPPSHLCFQIMSTPIITVPLVFPPLLAYFNRNLPAKSPPMYPLCFPNFFPTPRPQPTQSCAQWGIEAIEFDRRGAAVQPVTSFREGHYYLQRRLSQADEFRLGLLPAHHREAQLAAQAVGIHARLVVAEGTGPA